MNPLLANGQIISRVPLNLVPPQNGLPAQGIPSQLIGQQHATISSSFANGQLNVGSRLLQEQLFNGNKFGQSQQQQPQQLHQQPQLQSINQQFGQNQGSFEDTFGGYSVDSLNQFGDNLKVVQQRSVDIKNQPKKREVTPSDEKKLSKRGLVMLKDGSIVDDSLLQVTGLFEGLTQFGGSDFKEDANKKQNDLEDEIKEHDREPAEGEVQAVMSLCNKCAVEPFEGAIVLPWRELQTTTKNVLKALSTGSCGDF